MKNLGIILGVALVFMGSADANQSCIADLVDRGTIMKSLPFEYSEGANSMVVTVKEELPTYLPTEGGSVEDCYAIENSQERNYCYLAYSEKPAPSYSLMVEEARELVEQGSCQLSVNIILKNGSSQASKTSNSIPVNSVDTFPITNYVSLVVTCEI